MSWLGRGGSCTLAWTLAPKLVCVDLIAYDCIRLGINYVDLVCNPNTLNMFLYLVFIQQNSFQPLTLSSNPTLLSKNQTNAQISVCMYIICWEDLQFILFKYSILYFDFLPQKLHPLGPLHTWAKSRDHLIVRAQKKVSKGHSKTPPKSCSVVAEPQVYCEVICNRALNQMLF